MTIGGDKFSIIIVIMLPAITTSTLTLLKADYYSIMHTNILDIYTIIISYLE